jgi:hypothetical protein
MWSVRRGKSWGPVKRAAISVSLNVVNNALPIAVGASGTAPDTRREPHRGAPLVPGEVQDIRAVEHRDLTTSWPRSGDEVQ